tara:strand:- start:1623 stop:2597 length:975 start_codon:yes stop_codon:yes gene_type:complete
MAYSAWTANTVITLGTIVRPASAIITVTHGGAGNFYTQPTGLVFECTTAGTTGGTEPAFGTDVGSTITDNTVVWTAISSVFDDLYSFAPDKIIELFELKFTNEIAEFIGVAVYRFHNGLNEGFTANIVFNSNTYTAIPIKAEGFELTTQGTLPRPTLTIGNLDGTISSILKAVNNVPRTTNPSQTALFPGNDLLNTEVRRITTLRKYLDGQPDADPYAKYPDQIFFVDRKVSETRDAVQFELVSKMDKEGEMIPKRQCVSNICQWVYRSSECSYNGTSFFNVNDQSVVSASDDVCGKRLSSCKARFGQNNALPFGSFPSVGNIL